jgi:hypothetical protein
MRLVEKESPPARAPVLRGKGLPASSPPEPPAAPGTPSRLVGKLVRKRTPPRDHA